MAPLSSSTHRSRPRRHFAPPLDSPLDLFSPQLSSPSPLPLPVSSPWVPLTTNSSLLAPLEEEDEQAGEGDDLNLTHRLQSTSLNPQATSYLPLSVSLPPHSTPPPTPPTLRSSFPLPNLNLSPIYHHPTDPPLTPPPDFDPAPGSPIAHSDSRRSSASSSLPVMPLAGRRFEEGVGRRSSMGVAPWTWAGAGGGSNIREEELSSSSGGGGGGMSSSAMEARRMREGVFVHPGEQGASHEKGGLATRYVLVEGVPRHSSEADLRELIINRTPQARGCATHVLSSSGQVVLRFGDVRDAIHAVGIVSEIQVGGGRKLEARCVSRKEVELLSPHTTPSTFLSPTEGTLTLGLTLLLPSSPPSPPSLIPLLLPHLNQFGPLRSITPFEPHLFLCEYWDDEHATRAEEALNGVVIGGCRVGVAGEPSVYSTTLHPCPPSLPPHSFINPHHHPPPQHPTSTSYSSFPPPPPPTPPSGSSSSYLPYSIDSSPSPSPTFTFAQTHTQQGRSSMMMSPGRYATVGSTLPGASVGVFGGVGAVGGGGGGGGGGQESAYRPTWGIYRDDKIPASNVIHFDRIEQGLDVRTTIMLKNIPNKLGDEEVMKFIEEVAGQCWDVVYVRQDWKTGLNVGYGFINFTDTASLLRFARARIGTRWDLCGSDKLCIASYANIQGKASLIAHFRNSSVLDQHASRRPKLFYSKGHPLQGQPEPFPACDDPLRKARSAANASALGLFPSSKPVFRVAQALRTLNI